MKFGVVLGLVVAILLILASFVMLNNGMALHAGPIRLRMENPARLLYLAAALSAALAFVWRSKAGQRSAVVLIVACGLLALVAMSRQSRPTPPAGDFAVIESYIFQAMDGQLLLGPYSRFRWHHPGPIYFFVLAPFYVLSGFRTAGVSAAAVAINLASIAGIAFVLLRSGGGSLAVAATLFAVGYLTRFEAMFASQWNPHVLVLPSLALIVMAAAIATGSIELVPAVAVLAAFIVQTHLGLMPTIAVIILAALARAMMSIRHEPAAAARLRRLVNVSLWITLALWFLPLADELAHSPGNLTKLWMFFLDGRAHGQTLASAFQAWADGLSGFFRPDFGVAWGGRLETTVSIWAELCAMLQITLLAVVAFMPADNSSRTRVRQSLAETLLLASLAAFWSVTRIEGRIIDHEVFWISGLGALTAAVVVDAMLGPLAGRFSFIQGRPAVWACVVLFGIAAALGVRELKDVNYRSFNPADEEMAAESLSSDVIRYAQDRHLSRVLLDIDGPAWTVAAGVIVEMQKAHVPYAVTSNAVWMFGDAAAPHGDEAKTIAISAEEHHAQLVAQPGTTALSERRGFFADVLDGGSAQ